MSELTLTTIGWAMYNKGYSKEQLDNMSGIEVIMLKNDYSKWLDEEAEWENENNNVK